MYFAQILYCLTHPKVWAIIAGSLMGLIIASVFAGLIGCLVLMAMRQLNNDTSVWVVVLAGYALVGTIVGGIYSICSIHEWAKKRAIKTF